jgi:hypothetical protein
VRVQVELILVDEVVVIQRKLDEVAAADRAGREIFGPGELQPDILPVAHRGEMTSHLACPNT